MQMIRNVMLVFQSKEKIKTGFTASEKLKKLVIPSTVNGMTTQDYFRELWSLPERDS